MGTTDDGNSVPTFDFIKASNGLYNRLGALYSAIHRFIKIRVDKGCADTVSAVMFSPPVVGARKVTADINFVRDYLLRYKATGGTNFGPAFEAAAKLVDKDQDTVMVFLTDGEASEDSARSVASNLKHEMGDKFSLFCITLGPRAHSNNATVRGICSAGKGKMVTSLNGDELGMNT